MIKLIKYWQRRVGNWKWALITFSFILNFTTTKKSLVIVMCHINKLQVLAKLKGHVFYVRVKKL